MPTSSTRRLPDKPVRIGRARKGGLALREKRRSPEYVAAAVADTVTALEHGRPIRVQNPAVLAALAELIHANRVERAAGELAS